MPSDKRGKDYMKVAKDMSTKMMETGIERVACEAVGPK
jgi:hypothetical protein